MRHYFFGPAVIWLFQRRGRRTFASASPDTGPSVRHASAAPAGFADSVGPLRAASGGGPVQRNRHRSKSARDHSSCTRRPRSRTARTRRDGRTQWRSARQRRRGVDEPRLRQDTRPACVLSGTVWGAAPGQNCQVRLGAVLTLNSGSRPPACRGARGDGYPSSQQRHHRHASSLRPCQCPAHSQVLATPGRVPPTEQQPDTRNSHRHRSAGSQWVNSSQQTRSVRMSAEAEPAVRLDDPLKEAVTAGRCEIGR